MLVQMLRFTVTHKPSCDLCTPNSIYNSEQDSALQYIAGPPDENQVLFNESTWTNIIEPAASNAAEYMLSSPKLANCNPGQEL